jgi:hypothetical protein
MVSFTHQITAPLFGDSTSPVQNPESSLTR